MYNIEMDEMSDAFFPCWRAAGIHLSKQVDGGIQSWLRAHPYPPFLEHLSFRLGNQLFFVRVEDVDGKVQGPGNPQGFITAAKMANGHPCVLPMKKKFLGGEWVAHLPGWGLMDPQTQRPMDPVSLVTNEKIEMTPWELHDMAVQIVRDRLESEGFELMSWQGNPDVNPSIWFIGKSRRPEWVVVRTAKYPQSNATRPGNWAAIAASCQKLSPTGHFASVSLASMEQAFDPAGEDSLPLWRGHGMHVRFTGLQ